MHDSLTVNLCVGVRKDCPITYLLTADNQAEFSFGGARDGYDFAFEPASLRDFLKLGAEALAELDVRSAEEANAGATPDLATNEQSA